MGTATRRKKTGSSLARAVPAAQVSTATDKQACLRAIFKPSGLYFEERRSFEKRLELCLALITPADAPCLHHVLAVYTRNSNSGDALARKSVIVLEESWNGLPVAELQKSSKGRKQQTLSGPAELTCLTQRGGRGGEGDRMM